MSKRILRWFADFRNKEVLGMVEEHLELTQSAVLELYNMVCSAGENPHNKKSLYEKISEVEMKADALRRDMIVKLTERDVFPEERQDLMELVRAIDWVADWAREAGRILLIIPFESTPDEMKATAQNMCKACTDTVSILANCIQELSKDRMKAILRFDDWWTTNKNGPDFRGLKKFRLPDLPKVEEDENWGVGGRPGPPMIPPPPEWW